MNKLPKDMLNKIIEELDPSEFINFCASNVSDNVTKICNTNELWLKRLRKDFHYIIERFPSLQENAKDNYLKIFYQFSRQAEIFTNDLLEEYNEVIQFLTPEYKKLLYNHFFELLNEIIKKTNLEEDYTTVFLFDEVSDTFFSSKYDDFRYAYFPPNMRGNRWADMYFELLIDFIREFRKNLMSLL